MSGLSIVVYVVQFKHRWHKRERAAGDAWESDSYRNDRHHLLFGFIVIIITSPNPRSIHRRVTCQLIARVVSCDVVNSLLSQVPVTILIYNRFIDSNIALHLRNLQTHSTDKVRTPRRSFRPVIMKLHLHIVIVLLSAFKCAFSEVSHTTLPKKNVHIHLFCFPDNQQHQNHNYHSKSTRNRLLSGAPP